MSGITVTYPRRKNLPDPVALPAEHRHDSDVPFPVVGFDFNETLTPEMEYPITSGPFPGVKEVLDTFKDRGCCLHIMTSGLYFGTQDIPIYVARQRALQAWCDQYEIPIGFIGGKVPSDVYYDNDYVNVPHDNPDWLKIGEQIEAGLADRFNLIDGIYQPIEHEPVGTPMPDPVPDCPPLLPRGFSSARLDADFHRTLFTASSSQRYSPPKPGAKEAINAFYNAGITIRLSCAGWSPLTHEAVESEERFNGLVWQCAEYNVAYDRIVTKDFHHVGVDDKGIHASDWEKDLPLIEKMLKESDRTVPDLGWPA